MSTGLGVRLRLERSMEPMNSTGSVNNAWSMSLNRECNKAENMSLIESANINSGFEQRWEFEQRLVHEQEQRV